MIYADEKGNRFIVTVEGTKLPLVQSSIHIQLHAALSDGTIIGAADAIAVERSLAEHWFQKYHEATTMIADLREQLAAKE